MKMLRTGLSVLLFMAAAVQGAVWTGSDPGDVWSEPSNWSTGALPQAGEKVQLFHPSAQPCILDSNVGVTIGALAIGDNNGPVTMIIKDGGYLSTSDWNAVGYNRSATLIIEGGTFVCAQRFCVGIFDDADGNVTLSMTGGSLIINNIFYHGLNYDGSHNLIAHTQLDGGTLEVDGIDIKTGDMDITGGTLIINGDVTTLIETYKQDGRMTAYGGSGALVYDFDVTNPGETTVAATPPSGQIDNWAPLGSGQAQWSNDNNWSLGHKPYVFDTARISGDTDCILDFKTSVSNLYVGYGGNAGTLIIVDGGGVATGSGHSLKMDNGPGVIEVQEGAFLSSGEHFWVGIGNGSDGATLIVNGGTVDVGVGFDLGRSSSSAAGYCYLNEGVLECEHVTNPDSSGWYNNPNTLMDIKEGKFIVNRNLVDNGFIATLIAEGKLTAYGGSGTVIYDYGVTNPGKTTVAALPSIPGDANDDGGVGIPDLYMLTSAWLTSNCDNPVSFDEWCIVDNRDFSILSSNWLDGYTPRWHIAETQYPTDELIVTAHCAEKLGIVGDGTTDVTEAIQSALLSIDNMGGGTLFLPAGTYKISGNLRIPSGVILRGDWQPPQPGSPVAGTILQAYAGRGDKNAEPFIELIGSSGVKGITIWYPEQRPSDIQPYPPTIHGGGVTVENVTFVNSYFGFTTYREGTTARPFVRNVYGTPLKTGIEYDRLADIGRIETVHFSPDYWAGSGLAQAPTGGEHESWIYNNGTGLIVRRIDWSYSCYVTVDGYNIGLALRPSRWSEDSGRTPNGQSYGFDLINCKTGVYVENSSYAGYQFTRFDIQGAETGIYLDSPTSQATMFHTCRVDATNNALLNDGAAKVLMMSCDIQQGTIQINGGYLSAINSDFASTTTHHIKLNSGVKGASILGNRFIGGAGIVDNTSYPVNIDHTPLAVDPLPAYEYKKPATAFKPAQSDLFVVTDSPYDAQADGITDDTAAFQAALADADANGGGIVFVPGGHYRLDGNLTIPTGVELRGVVDIPHGSGEKGSLLNVYGGRNDANGIPFIQIASGAGIRGLTFHYPEQIYDENDTVNYGMVPYPFLMRGLGADIYIINVSATIPYQLLDLATYRCDRHYVDYILATALKTGIQVGSGSTDGQIHNCQFNPSAFTHQGNIYDSIPTGTSANIHKILWRDSKPYVFGDMTGEVLHENFVFGGLYGVYLINENGAGPSGYCMGMGVDACTTAIQVNDVGESGLDMINSQIVSTNGNEGHYLETDVGFQDTFRMFSSAGWGMHEYSVVLNGGDVRLQLFHLARDGEAGTFQVFNEASVRNLGGNLTDYLAPPRPFLSIDATASAEFLGNIIHTDASNMPTNSANVTSVGNLRVQ